MTKRKPRGNGKEAGLKQRVAELESLLPPLALTVVFAPTGQILHLMGPPANSAAALRATREALRVVERFVEEQLLAAVAKGQEEVEESQ